MINVNRILFVALGLSLFTLGVNLFLDHKTNERMQPKCFTQNKDKFVDFVFYSKDTSYVVWVSVERKTAFHIFEGTQSDRDFETKCPKTEYIQNDTLYTIKDLGIGDDFVIEAKKAGLL